VRQGTVTRLKKIFIDCWSEHPNSIGESYWEHFFYAFQLGSLLIKLGTMVLIHSIFPFLFKTTASEILFKVVDEIRARGK
jgi:hypothetical protein